MNTILYRIPDKYFPGVIVKSPFHAKVNYEAKSGVVEIYDVALSALCLKHIRDTDRLIKEMREDISLAEARRANQHVDKTIMGALAPHINH